MQVHSGIEWALFKWRLLSLRHSVYVPTLPSLFVFLMFAMPLGGLDLHDPVCNRHGYGDDAFEFSKDHCEMIDRAEFEKTCALMQLRKPFDL